MLDSVGGHDIRVLPCTQDMLYGTVDAAVWTPEIDWSQPRPGDWIMGGGWGSQRAVLFAGLRCVFRCGFASALFALLPLL